MGDAYKAVGVHVFAGGFTLGVNKVFDVQCQLERHGFGGETCEQVVGVPFINVPSGNWDHVDAQFAFGNPRCTGFSTITAGYGDDCHGPWAKQTADIHDFCKYVVNRYDIAIWESVQQAYSVGRPLLDHLRDEIFVPNHYRIAHVFINAASFGNAQQRKRYFFVAYRDDRNFNITPPTINPYYSVLYDAIHSLKDRKTREGRFNASEYDYDFDTYDRLTQDEKAAVPFMPNGWCMNRLAKYMTHRLTPKQRSTWELRCSDMPFSMHCIYRLNWLRPSPTMHNSCGRWLHPDHNRPMTVGELATIMGWEGKIPAGRDPAGQLAKGIVPAVGEWLAWQAISYLRNDWGDEDWESSYDPVRCVWAGQSCHGQVEKVFDLTRYVGPQFDMERYPMALRKNPQSHVAEVDHAAIRKHATGVLGDSEDAA